MSGDDEERINSHQGVVGDMDMDLDLLSHKTDAVPSDAAAEAPVRHSQPFDDEDDEEDEHARRERQRRAAEKRKGKRPEQSPQQKADAKAARRRARRLAQQAEEEEAYLNAYRPILTIKSSQGFVWNQVWINSPSHEARAPLPSLLVACNF